MKEETVKSGITRESLKKLVDYVFRDGISSKEVADNNLYITDNEEYLSFRFGRITMEFEGFIKMFKEGIIFGIEDIYYNGVLLDEVGRKQFYEQTFNFAEK